MKPETRELTIEELTREIERDHEFWDYANRGYLYIKQGNLERSIEDFTTCIKMTDNTTYYCDRGEAYLLRGNFDLAIKDFTFVIDCFESSDDNYLPSLEGRAKAYRAIDEIELAELDFNRANELRAKI